MGVDYSVKIGPYIQVYSPKVANKEEYHTCPNISCRRHKQRISDKFCNQCGSEIKLIEFSCLKEIDFDCCQQNNDRLFEILCEYKTDTLKNWRFFIGNVKDTPSHNVDIMDGANEYEITPAKIDEQLKIFSIMYSLEIVQLKKVFGIDKVFVKYGVLNWAW